VEFDPLGNKGSITDPDKAKQLLTEAGKVGYEIKWYYQADVPEPVAGMKAVSASLEASGFKASPIASSSDTIRDDLENPNAPTNVASVGWCSDWPSGSTWFPQVWYGPLIKQNPTSAPNKSYLDDPTVNKKIDQIVAEPLSKSLPAWGELDKYIMTTIYPNVVTGYEGTAFLRGSKVGGFISTTDGMPPFANMFVTK
jgi:peptide/nickel transport system substrate-binding protein